MQRLWILCVMLALGMSIAPVAQGQLITSLERTNSENGEPQLVAEGLEVGGPVFVDRTHEYLVLPEFLLGLEYAMLANNDKVDPDFQLHVTLERSARLYLFLDNRIGDNDGDNPPNREFGDRTEQTGQRFDSFLSRVLTGVGVCSNPLENFRQFVQGFAHKADGNPSGDDDQDNVDERHPDGRAIREQQRLDLFPQFV